ncbi:hypothetical protein C4D60_Mb11t22470 [Musa balbisiana]|uniref:Uncharacterized protein n=1 Tax=Musa balbisiana TaxID=52838 RepID=A0A4S8J5Z8_MUSBA|nr:hypothetical protein C4D60_Mb11t22470 [Musa balbisiana]
MDQKQPLNHLFTLLLLSCLLSLEAAPLSSTLITYGVTRVLISSLVCVAGILASRNQDRAVMKAAVQVIDKEMIVT